MFEFEYKEKHEYKVMNEMEPCEIGIIVDTDSLFEGEVVMRTATVHNFEVMSLSKPKASHCWDEMCELKVKVIPNCKLTLTEL